MMMMVSVIIAMIFLLQSVERISAIQCYYCRELDYHCPMPLNLDGGDESNENDIDTGVFDPGFACMSDHSMNPRTGQAKLILRGIDHCEEIDVPNRRVHCCYTDNCNKQLPALNIKTLSDMMSEEMEIDSKGYEHIPSLMLSILAIVVQYFH